MPSVATSFFLPSAGAALPGVAPTAAAGFGVALANAVPAPTIAPPPTAATVPLPGLATPATLTVLNDIATPREAVPTPGQTPSAPITPPLSPIAASQPAIEPAPPKPTVATGLAREPQPAILVISGSKMPAQDIATATEALPTPASPKFMKTLPTILVAFPVAAAPPTDAAEGEAMPVRQTPPGPVAAATGSQTATPVATPATTTALIDTMAAPTTPPASTVRIADKVETPRRTARTEVPGAPDAPAAETPVPDAGTLTMAAPPAAAIVVAAATPAVTPPAKLPASEAPTGDPVVQDPVPATTDAPVPMEQILIGRHPPVFLRTQEPRATEASARNPGLLLSQEHGAAFQESALVPPIATPAPATHKADEAPEPGRKSDKPVAPPVEPTQTPDLPVAMPMPQPTPAAPNPVVHALVAHAAEAKTAPSAPAQALAAAAGPPIAPDPASPAPVPDKPAPVEFASHVAAPAEARTAAADAVPAPAGVAPAAPPVPGPSLLTPAAQIAAAALPISREAGTVAAEPGKIGREMGVIIARHAATGGGETITVRLDPKDMGRIDVTLSFDDDGRLRAVVAADNPAALDLLRRDSADLNRALVDAGVRADQQSFRFDTRSGGGEQAESGQSGQRREQARANFTDSGPAELPDEPDHRPRAASGRIDMMA